MAEVKDEDLHRFGWAPGFYTIPCIDCPKDQSFLAAGMGAKRSSRCRPHAVEAFEKAQSAPAAPDVPAPVDGERVRRMLLDLLAVIHRDGGHYVEEHGLEKAVADAMQLSSERIAQDK